MRTLVLALLLVVCQAGYSQIMNYEKVDYPINLDSVEIKVGDTLKLNFGSGVNKQFVFVTVQVGKGLMAMPMAAPSHYANELVIVEEIHDMKAKYRKMHNKSQPIPICRLTYNHTGSKKLYVFFDPADAILSGEVSLR